MPTAIKFPLCLLSYGNDLGDRMNKIISYSIVNGADKLPDEVVCSVGEEYDDHIDSCILAVEDDEHFVRIEKRAKETGISLKKAKSYILRELKNQAQPVPNNVVPINEYSDVQKVLKKYEDISKDMGKPMGYHVIHPDYKLVIDKISAGYTFIAFSLDTLLLGTLCRELLKLLRSIQILMML